MMRRVQTILFLVVLMQVGAILADAGDGYALMKQSEEATKSQTEVTRYRLELLDSDANLVQARDMLFHFKRLEDKESTVIRFLSPPAISGTGLLIEDKGTSANDIWLYLPATRRLRRISGAEKTNWFMGTEFTHEDFEDYQLPLYHFTLLERATCPSGPCDKVRAVAVDPEERDATGYSSKVYYIDSRTLYPVRIDYYGKDEHLLKVLKATGLNRKGTHWRPDRIEMRNLVNGRQTLLVTREREVDGKLNDSLVSKRYLRTVP
jgi:hypothetical protein